MWHMQDGKRVLYPAEWELIRYAAHSLLTMLDEDKKLGKRGRKLGVRAFDRLSYQQKTYLLWQVLHAAAKDSQVPELPLTSVNESVIGALFKILHESLSFELSLRYPEKVEALSRTRRLILAAAVESNDPISDLPSLESTDFEQWRMVLDEIEERILWDADYEMEDAFMDLPPEQAQLKRDMFGIDDDYFVAVAPEPSEAEYEAARNQLSLLLPKMQR